MNEKNWMNIETEDTENEVAGSVAHEVNMETKALVRNLSAKGIPVFLAYYLPGKGYKYRATFPEEINTPEVKSEFDKFKKFLKVVIDFNKEDYLDTNIQS